MNTKRNYKIGNDTVNNKEPWFSDAPAYLYVILLLGLFFLMGLQLYLDHNSDPIQNTYANQLPAMIERGGEYIHGK